MDDWPEPRVTPNSMLLSGYIIGALSAVAQERWVTYRFVSADVQAGTAVVERMETGNRYRISVEQIAGQE
jgi:hypothetical protein